MTTEFWQAIKKVEQKASHYEDGLRVCDYCDKIVYPKLSAGLEDHRVTCPFYIINEGLYEVEANEAETQIF